MSGLVTNKPDWLLARIAEVKANGGEYIQLVKCRRGGNSPKNWSRARIEPGRPSLWGKSIGPGRILGSWLFDVKITDAEAWLAGNFEVRSEP